MKRIIIWAAISGSILHAAPVATNKQAAVSNDVTKNNNRRNEQLLTDLTRITLGVGCCVASLVAFTWGYQAFTQCAKHNEVEVVIPRVASQIGWKQYFKDMGSEAWKGAGETVTSVGVSIGNFGVGLWNRIPSRAAMNAAVFGRNAQPAATPAPPPPAAQATPTRSTRRSPSPELTGSPLGAVADKKFVGNYVQALGYGTAGLITGIVGLRLIMKGLHIELTKAKKSDKKKIETDEDDE